MPYKSKAQAAYMHINHPKIAKKWDKEYETPANLPQHVDDKYSKLNEELNKKKKNG